jgi:hypothetical protein
MKKRDLIAAALLLTAGPAFAGPGIDHDDAVYPEEVVSQKPARRVDVTITDAGPQPAAIDAHPDERLLLMITRKTERVCRNDLLIPAYGVRTPLPLGAPMPVAVLTREKGRVELVCPVEDTIGEVNVR